MRQLMLIYFIVLLQLDNALSLDNGLALTPPMGWLSWERFRCLTNCTLFPNDCLSENLIKRTADKMVSEGYLDAGYEYIIIDDCWSEMVRDEGNRLQADFHRFPNGIKHLADYVHNLGLKLGIYADYGTFTCGGYPGSIDFLQIDAETFAEWEIDYLKLDGCYAELSDMEAGYANMSRMLNKTERPIVFSCEFPLYKGLMANYSAAEEFCNSWRNYGDIQDSWTSVADITDWFSTNQDFLVKYAGPGHWNDPDMLIIGNFGLSLEQSKSQMTIWSILAAPLIMSVDLESIQPDFKNILLNQNAIRVNQDPLGNQGKLNSAIDDILIWTKDLSDEGIALGVVSYRTDGYFFPYRVALSSYLQADRKYMITDVFNESSEFNGMIVANSDEIITKVPPTGALFLIFTLAT